jgi:hypothetical protein
MSSRGQILLHERNDPAKNNTTDKFSAPTDKVTDAPLTKLSQENANNASQTETLKTSAVISDKITDGVTPLQGQSTGNNTEPALRRKQAFVDYLLECPYPLLFSPDTGECTDPHQVACRWRFEPKAPCKLSLSTESLSP